MDRETVQDYLRRAGMEKAQSEALSNILAELATKADLRLLEIKIESRFDAFEQRIESRFDAKGLNVESRFDVFEQKIDRKLEALKSDLTWRMTAVVVFFATVMTLLGRFVD